MPRDEDDLDALLEAMFATCPCDACERYRRHYDAKVDEYARKLRRSLGLD